MLLNTAGQALLTRAHSPGACEDGPADREQHRSWNWAKERGAWNAEHWHDEGPVEVVIAHLARGLGYKRATVTSGTVQPAPLHAPAWRVLGADRIVRTKRTDPQRVSYVLLNMAGLLHQAAECPVRVRTSRIEQYSEAPPKTICVNALAHGARLQRMASDWIKRCGSVCSST
jgi:hypothetical protein